MSIFNRKKGNVTYRYFKKGGTEQMYLGPLGKEDPARVKEALTYVRNMKEEYVRHYEDLEEQLLVLLPEEERRRLLETEEPLNKVMKTLPLLISRSRGSPAVVDDLKKKIEKLAEKEREEAKKTE